MDFLCVEKCRLLCQYTLWIPIHVHRMKPTGANQTQEEIQLDLLQLQSHCLAKPAGGDIWAESEGGMEVDPGSVVLGLHQYLRRPSARTVWPRDSGYLSTDWWPTRPGEQDIQWCLIFIYLIYRYFMMIRKSLWWHGTYSLRYHCEWKYSIIKKKLQSLL